LLKKLFVAILAFFYLAIASGVIVNLHYCMGELASVEYGHAEEDKCGKCGMPDNNPACCHTESKLVKLQDDHQLSALHFAFKQAPAEQPVMPVQLAAISHHHATELSWPIHAPPDQVSHNIYLLNCVFRI